MSDDDLIRRKDALAAVQGFGYGWHAEEVIAALPAVTVGVKPLVWIEIEDDDCDFEAFASGLRYWIISVTDHQHTVKCNTYEIGDCLTVEKAKAAAQADYEARILAALEPVQKMHTLPAPTDAALDMTNVQKMHIADPAAIREAAQVERMQNLIDAYEDIMDYGIVFAKRDQHDRLKAAKEKLK